MVVNPSPVPEPQSFQNLIPGTRRIIGRAAPIITSAHNRSIGVENLKKLRETACIYVLIDKFVDM